MIKKILAIFKDIYKNKKFAWQMALRDIHLQYAGSSIGFLWAVIHPILMIAVYSIVFSGIMGIKSPRAAAHDSPFLYTIYLCCGLLPWFAFSDALTKGCNAFINNAGIIKKINFPSIALIVSNSIGSMITLGINMLAFIILLYLTGFGLPWLALFGFPLLFILQTLFLFGCVLLFASLNVFYRDISQVLVFITMLWFWMTPIVYVEQAINIPTKFIWIFRINPFYHIIEMYRTIILDRMMFSLTSFFSVLGLSIFLLGFSLWAFSKLESDILDNI